MNERESLLDLIGSTIEVLKEDTDIDEWMWINGFCNYTEKSEEYLEGLYKSIEEKYLDVDYEVGSMVMDDLIDLFK